MKNNSDLPKNLYWLPSGRIRVSVFAWFHSKGKSKSLMLGSFEENQIDLAVALRDLVKGLQGDTVQSKRKVHVSVLEKARDDFRAANRLLQYYQRQKK